MQFLVLLCQEFWSRGHHVVDDSVSAQADHEVHLLLANVWLVVAHRKVCGAPHAVANIVDGVTGRSIMAGMSNFAI